MSIYIGPGWVRRHKPLLIFLYIGRWNRRWRFWNSSVRFVGTSPAEGTENRMCQLISGRSMQRRCMLRVWKLVKSGG